jgi:tetratricopeptide (TPR) repeat protein
MSSKWPETPSNQTKDQAAWQNLVAEARDSGQTEKAVELAKQAVIEHPGSDWLWRVLGGELIELELLDDAENALDIAHSLDPNSDWLWRHFAALHRMRQDLDAEIESLEILARRNLANGNDYNQLGTAYHKHGDFAKAVNCYRRSAAAEPQPDTWVNLAVVYSDSELSQDADAADSCCRALEIKADHKKAKELLDSIQRKLSPLADQALTAANGLIEPDEFYEFYINPFELLQIEDVTVADKLNAKEIQQAKKRLLHELELNDGLVSWLDDHSLDKSRALALVDELDDDAKRRYHLEIFRNKPLLDFLTRGDIRHFLYSSEYFPGDTEELLHRESEFRIFLSKPFARQYNRILTAAIEHPPKLPVIEVLFDGRRWVDLQDDDLCFGGAYKRVGSLVEKLEEKIEATGSRKVSMRRIEEFFRKYSFPEIFSLLPTHFAAYQEAVVASLRSIAIDCFNEHDDADLSNQLLALCKQFRFRSVALARKLEEDTKQIEAIIAENRKKSFSAEIIPGQSVEITPAGIQAGKTIINSSDVESIRWEIDDRADHNMKGKYSFYLVVGGGHANTTLKVEWENRNWVVDKVYKSAEELSITELPPEEQRKTFQKMIEAVLANLVPKLLEKLIGRLQTGKSITIGPCTLTETGISFTRGFYFQTEYFLPWNDVYIETSGGTVTVKSRSDFNAKMSMSTRNTDNAIILPVLHFIMKDRGGFGGKFEPGIADNLPRSQEILNKPALVKSLVIAMFVGAIVSIVALIVGSIMVLLKFNSKHASAPKTFPDPPAVATSVEQSNAPPVAPSVPKNEYAVQTPSPRPIALPINGSVTRYHTSPASAPFTIVTRNGSGHYFVKLRDNQSRNLVLAVFVREGEEANITVPLGTYELSYATGRTWYGSRSDQPFGSETRYARADDTFTFQVDGNYIQGYTVELYLQAYGNLDTQPISASEF